MLHSGSLAEFVNCFPFFSFAPIACFPAFDAAIVSVFAMQPKPTDRLDSWKELAAFLGREERTAMRSRPYTTLPAADTPAFTRSL